MTRSVRAGSSSQRARELESVHGELVGALAALKQAHALGGPGIDLILQGYIAGRADYVAEDAADGNDRNVCPDPVP
jgi:hypothetical protein